MSFPAYGTSVPTLTPLQFSYLGVTFGGVVQGATYQTQKISGIDSMTIGGGDVQRPYEKGMFAGIDTAGGRDITITLAIKAASGSALATARQAISAIMAPRGAIEAPLWIASESATFAAMARPEKFSFDIDTTALVAYAVTSSLLFRCTDPRLYATPTKQSAAQSVSGLTLPFTLPGVLGGTSTFSVTNGGNVETRPLLVFSGPSIGPGMMNQTITGSPWIQFNTTLASGDVLTVDTDAHTAVVVRSGSSVGSSVAGTWVQGGTWWDLVPGANTLQYFSGGISDTGTAVVQSADAYVGL